MTAAKNDVFLVYKIKFFYKKQGDSALVEAIKIWQGAYLGGFFPDRGRDDKIFETYFSETYSSEPTKFT